MGIGKQKFWKTKFGRVGWRSCVLVYTLLPGLLSPSEMVTIYQNSNLF